MDTSPHHAPWGTGCGRAQFSLCEISAYAPLRHRKSSFLRGVVRVSCCNSESCSASARSKDCCLRRPDLMKQSKAWQAARAVPATVENRHNKARSQAFGAELERFGFSSREI